jgi:cell division protein FtsB
MLTTVFILIVAMLGFLALRLRDHYRAVRALRDALTVRKPLLRDGLPGTLGADWDELCAAGTRLIEEVNRLDQQHTGQLAQLEETHTGTNATTVKKRYILVQTDMNNRMVSVKG